jgi:hypothetical protein
MSTLPNCFGRLWDPRAVECTGGLDSLYTNPGDGTHKRERCNWYSQCSVRTTAADMEKRNLVSPQNLIRPPQPGVLVSQPPSPISPVKPGAIQIPTPMAMQTHYANYVTPQQAYYGPAMVPANYQQPGMQVLGYLAVPEPISPIVPWWMRLFHEMGRAALKGLFHTGANFFDHNPMSRPPGT